MHIKTINNGSLFQPDLSVFDKGGVIINALFHSIVDHTITNLNLSCSQIRSWAFGGYVNLLTASFSQCNSIGANAFANCFSLTTVSFPNCISIGQSAFYCCSNLTMVSFPKC